MRQNVILVFLMVVFISTSCVSSKWHKDISDSAYLENNLANLNGIYNNIPSSYDVLKGVNFNPNPLYALLFNPDKVYNWDEERNYSGRIKIEAISNKKIKVYYIVDDKVVDEKVISGKLKNNIFSVNKKFRFLFLGFFNYYHETKSTIYLDINDELYVYNDIFSFANVLIASGGGDKGFGGSFSRIDTESIDLP